MADKIQRDISLLQIPDLSPFGYSELEEVLTGDISISYRAANPYNLGFMAGISYALNGAAATFEEINSDDPKTQQAQTAISAMQRISENALNGIISETKLQPGDEDAIATAMASGVRFAFNEFANQERMVQYLPEKEAIATTIEDGKSFVDSPWIADEYGKETKLSGFVRFHTAILGNITGMIEKTNIPDTEFDDLPPVPAAIALSGVSHSLSHMAELMEGPEFREKLREIIDGDVGLLLANIEAEIVVSEVEAAENMEADVSNNGEIIVSGLREGEAEPGLRHEAVQSVGRDYVITDIEEGGLLIEIAERAGLDVSQESIKDAYLAEVARINGFQIEGMELVHKHERILLPTKFASTDLDYSRDNHISVASAEIDSSVQEAAEEKINFVKVRIEKGDSISAIAGRAGLDITSLAESEAYLAEVAAINGTTREKLDLVHPGDEFVLPVSAMGKEFDYSLTGRVVNYINTDSVSDDLGESLPQDIKLEVKGGDHLYDMISGLARANGIEDTSFIALRDEIQRVVELSGDVEHMDRVGVGDVLHIPHDIFEESTGPLAIPTDLEGNVKRER